MRESTRLARQGLGKGAMMDGAGPTHHLADRIRTILADEVARAGSAARDGESLEHALGLMLATVELQFDGLMLASILLLDSDGRRLRHAAAPSLPGDYCRAIDGVVIGPNVGSCGTAAYLGHAVYVTDIANDPLWIDFRGLAAQHGLRACWSTPIQGRRRPILGTFAIYYRTPRSPTPDELLAIRHIVDCAADTIEKCAA